MLDPKKLQTLREAKGMSQGDLADAMGGISRQAISNLERGGRDVTAAVLCRLAKSLDCSITDLVTCPKK